MTNDETLELAHREAWRYKKSSDPHHSDTYTFNRSTLLEFARKLNAVAREECALFLESEARAWEEYMKTDEAKEAEEEDSGCSGYMSQARVDTLYEAATEIRERSNAKVRGPEAASSPEAPSRLTGYVSGDDHGA